MENKMINQNTGKEAIKFVIPDMHNKGILAFPDYTSTTYMVATDAEGRRILSLTVQEKADETVRFNVEFSGETKLMSAGFRLTVMKSQAQKVFTKVLAFEFQDFDVSLQEDARRWASFRKISFDYPEFVSANLFAKDAFYRNNYIVVGDTVYWVNSWQEEEGEHAPKWTMAVFVRIPALASRECLETSSLDEIYAERI
jgi:hypothetical protein